MYKPIWKIISNKWSSIIIYVRFDWHAQIHFITKRHSIEIKKQEPTIVGGLSNVAVHMYCFVTHLSLLPIRNPVCRPISYLPSNRIRRRCSIALSKSRKRNIANDKRYLVPFGLLGWVEFLNHMLNILCHIVFCMTQIEGKKRNRTHTKNINIDDKNTTTKRNKGRENILFLLFALILNIRGLLFGIRLRACQRRWIKIKEQSIHSSIMETQDLVRPGWSAQ